MAWKEGADARLLAVIQAEQDEPLMVTSFVLVATAVTGEGGEDVIVNAAPGQRSMTTLGLLRGGLVIEEEGFRRDWFEDED